jgi:hypothetical protein
VEVKRNSIVDVTLRLLRVDDGSARVCVDIEDWPKNPACPQPPPPPKPTVFSGCWKLIVTKTNALPGTDPVEAGILTITQQDSNLTGKIVWKSGARDSSRGHVRYDGRYAYFDDSVSPGSFYIKSVIDSGRTGLYGHISSVSRNLYGDFKAARTACDAVHPVDPLPTKVCYDVSRKFLSDEIKIPGRLVMETLGRSVVGVFRWQGSAPERVSGTSDPSQNGVYHVDLAYVPPPIQGTDSPLLYSGNYSDPPTEAYGSIVSLGNAPPTTLGYWQGFPSVCSAKDSLP